MPRHRPSIALSPSTPLSPSPCLTIAESSTINAISSTWTCMRCKVTYSLARARRCLGDGEVFCQASEMALLGRASSCVDLRATWEKNDSISFDSSSSTSSSWIQSSRTIRNRSVSWASVLDLDAWREWSVPGSPTAAACTSTLDTIHEDSDSDDENDVTPPTPATAAASLQRTLQQQAKAKGKAEAEAELAKAKAIGNVGPAARIGTLQKSSWLTEEAVLVLEPHPVFPFTNMRKANSTAIPSTSTSSPHPHELSRLDRSQTNPRTTRLSSLLSPTIPVPPPPHTPLRTLLAHSPPARLFAAPQIGVFLQSSYAKRHLAAQEAARAERDVAIKVRKARGDVANGFVRDEGRMVQGRMVEWRDGEGGECDIRGGGEGGWWA